MNVLYTILGVLMIGVLVYIAYIFTLPKPVIVITKTNTNTASLPRYADISDNQVTLKPYTTSSINGVDDYEYSMIFQNEADQDLSSVLKNKLSSQYPMTWSVHPPSSTYFQEGMRDTQEQAQEPASNPYTALTDDSLKPPDTLATEAAEREIIQTYKPKNAGDLTTYDVDDAMEIIKKIYDKKNEIPTIVKKENNVYEIVGTRKKDEKVVYEETDTEAPSTMDPTRINIPQAAADLAVDPFFSSSPDTQNDRWNYRQWTPGLQRMFAPTEPQTNWY